MADKKNEQSREVRSADFIYEEGEPSEKYIGPKKNVRDITVKVNVDVSEALVGLKALQREAREAAKALKELEAAQEKTQGVGEITLSDATLLRLRDVIHAKSFPVTSSCGTGGTRTTDGVGISQHSIKIPTTHVNIRIPDVDAEALISSAKSITDDITRSYGLGGESE